MNVRKLLGLGLVLLLSTAAQAMPIAKFDRLSTSDQNAYASLLVVGVKNALIAHQKPDQAKEVAELFSRSGPTGGAAEFFKNLQGVRDLNARNAADPNNRQPAYEVEHAFFLTLKQHGIIVPMNVLMEINKAFKPSSPLQ